ncbi:hypothetical protein TeGR_g7718 [Tetraparma gracilis]|uniref:Peptidase S9 prolyl oligopeptidase catalytic domain-containing protein n=1 Tax=Tetraparma gracilis TaxID=2962635 RepID=A0ABQ6N5Q0_9STRA|nr:hypothetical protein TeGR_g7718 [Tetraparma gracilis]
MPPPPLSASLVNGASIGLPSLLPFGPGLAFARTEGGKTELLQLGGPNRPISGDDNVRSVVHEYGGAAAGTLSFRGDDALVWTAFPSRRLSAAAFKDGKWKELGPIALSGAPDVEVLRFADFASSPAHPDTIFCVCEDHTKDTPSEVVNTLVAIKISQASPSSPLQGAITTIASGSDFYSYPAVTDDGSEISFVSWEHPYMPWDVTTISSLPLLPPTVPADCPSPPADAAPTVRASQQSNLMPAYAASPANDLYFISDSSRDLYTLHKSSPSSPTVSAPLPNQPPSFDYSAPGMGWSLGARSFCIAGGKLAALYGCVESGTVGLQAFDLEKPEEAPKTATQADLGCTAISNPCAVDGTLYYVSSSHSSPTEISSVQLPDLSSPPATALATLDASDELLSTYAPSFTAPDHIKFKGPSGDVHAYYYAPAGPAPPSPPPLLVKAHGGPTSATSVAWRLDIQYWCARGFAVLDVDYSGSCGYGREYRNRLLGRWGVADLQDVIAGAAHCVGGGLADGKRVAIDGGSAGGYTTLCALAFQGEAGPFTAGCSKYGIADLMALYDDTHKFESRYMDRLIGELPAMADVYKARCPINFVDNFNCPILLQQGDEDKVVPPNQAELMFEATTKKDIDSILIVYEGEQHGFRAKENVIHALETEYEFYCKAWKVEPVEPEKHGLKLGEKIVVQKKGE